MGLRTWHALQFLPIRTFLRDRPVRVLAIAQRTVAFKTFYCSLPAYYFYGCWNPKFLSLLIVSTIMDYACGIWVDRVEDPRWRRGVVALSMALNLGILGYFKYFNFFAESLQSFLARLGVSIPLGHLEVALPIGISFYTFQSMSYVIDVYRRQIKPTRNLIEFATFVSFFPHLVAGPIMRPTTLLPQVASRRTV